MESYKEFLKSEVQEFRKAGHRFLEKEISKAEFKGISGGMGVYAQQDQKSFMIRLRTPSGLISKEHLNLILSYVHKYGLEKVHLTTRQAVQLHDLDIDSVCDIMEDGIDHDLFTRGGGGNFPRNVSLSPLAGVEKAEAFDVTPYALQVGNYFLGNAPSYKLPRKLKVAFSSDEKDTAAASINDMGILQSQKLCRGILAAVKEAGLCESRLPMIQISGCPNSCARHQVAEIGFAGRKVKVGDRSEDAFQLFVGGSVSGADTHMGELQGVMLASEIPQYIVELGKLLEQEEKSVTEIAECECFKELTEKFLVS